MKLNRKLLLPLGLFMATAQFTSMNAGAAEVCDTLESCRELREQLERRIGVILTGDAPSLTDMARNVDGHVRELSHYDADRYCHDLGLRLPTSRRACRLGA